MRHFLLLILVLVWHWDQRYTKTYTEGYEWAMEKTKSIHATYRPKYMTILPPDVSEQLGGQGMWKIIWATEERD